MRQPVSYFLDQNYPYTVTPDPGGGFGITFPDLPGCITQVDTFGDVGPAAEEIRILWLETAYAHDMDIPLPQGGAEYSGKFVVRVPRSLHKRLAQSAELDGVSLNQYVVSLLAANDAIVRVERCLDAERRRGDLPSAVGRQVKDSSDRQRAGLSIVGKKTSKS